MAAKRIRILPALEAAWDRFERDYNGRYRVYLQMAVSHALDTPVLEALIAGKAFVDERRKMELFAAEITDQATALGVREDADLHITLKPAQLDLDIYSTTYVWTLGGSFKVHAEFGIVDNYSEYVTRSLTEAEFAASVRQEIRLLPTD